MSRAILVLSLLISPVDLLFSATNYTISPLLDASKPGQVFLFGYPGPGHIAVNQTPYLEGTAYSAASPLGQPAAGKLDNCIFSFSTLNPLPGGDGARLIGVLKDGSAVGTSYTLLPSPNPLRPPLEVPTLVRWVNGVPSELPLSSLGDPGAVFTPGYWAVNGEGDLVGQYSLNGVTSLFRYNALSGDFEVIDLEVAGAAQVVAWAINDAGQILVDVNGASSLTRLYDPVTGGWTPIPNLPGSFLQGTPFLSSAGQVAMMLNVNGVDRVFEFKNGVLSPATPDALPGQGPARNLLGYNAQGLLVGSEFATLGTYENGQFLALFQRLANPDGWLDLSFFTGFLAGVNDAGQIFGVGNYQGRSTAFVLNPILEDEVPEPASVRSTGGGCPPGWSVGDEASLGIKGRLEAELAVESRR